MSAKSHGKRIVAWFVFLAILSGLLYGFYFIRHLGMAPRPTGPAPASQVVTTKPLKDMANRVYKNVGQTEAINQVDLKARVEGALSRINFVEGSFVNKGDVLFEVQKDKYEATVNSSRAALNDAKSAYARDLKYLQRLEKTEKGGVSEKALDDARTTAKASAATVEKADAALKVAELDLQYTSVTAPISGKIGKTSFTIGNVVNLNSGALATIVQTTPIYAVFAIGEDKALNITTGKTTFQDADVYLELSNGKQFEYPGKLVFMDNNINQTSGTVMMRATFPNPEEVLMPGQFVNVIIKSPEKYERVTVPGAAILQDQAGSYVLTVTSDNHSVRTPVTVGEQAGKGLIEIKGGLKGDETVIYKGMEKAAAGANVAATEQTFTADQPPATPAPAESKEAK